MASRKHGNTKSDTSARARLQLEPLEPRLLLSASILQLSLNEQSALPPSYAAEPDDIAMATPPVLDASADTGLEAANFDGELTPSGDSPEVGTRALVFDARIGTWADAEKDSTSSEDDLLCWAATASNMLEWAGWGYAGGMTNADEFLDYFEAHWTDEGGLPKYAIEWWLNGTNGKQGDAGWSQVDVAGANFYPDFDYTDYYEFDSDPANVMDHIDDWTAAGYAMGLSLRGGGLAHEVTCWGYNYDPGETPGDPDYYLGVWITDSDDNKGVADGHTAPNDLHYYAIDWDATDNHWNFDSYFPGSHLGYCTALYPYSSGVVTINGDQDGVDDNDDISVQLNGAGTHLEVRLNGDLVYTNPVSIPQEINIKGWGGDDTLTVDFSNGDPLAGITVNFDGGVGDTDELVITGGTGEIGSYLPGTTAGDGVVQVGGSTISFTGLEPVTVSGFAEFTFVTPNSNDVITVDSPAAGRNRISGTSGGVAFESLTFYDVDHFLLDTATNDNPLADPNDHVTFSSDLVASGLDSFTVDLGPGNDEADASAMTSSSLTGVTLLGGAGQDTLIGGDGSTTNTILGGDDADEIIVTGGANDVDGGAGSDTLNLWDRTTAGAFVVSRSGDEQGIVVTGPAVGAWADDIEQVNIGGDFTDPGSSVLIHDLSGTTVRKVLSGGAANPGGFGTDTLAGTLTVEGRLADDNIHISDGGDFAGSDSVLINLAWGEVQLLSNPAAGTLVVNGLEGNDTIKAESDVPVDNVTLNGGAGNDYLSADATLNGGAGNDVFVGGPGTNTVNGGAGGDTILVRGTAGNDTIAVTESAGAVTVDVNGTTTTYAAGSSFEQIRIEALAGDDIISVEPLAATAYNVLGGPPNGQMTQPGGDALNIIGGSAPVFHPGPEPDAGWWTFASDQPVSFDEIEMLLLDGIVVLVPDQLEVNNSIADATVLGSLPKITLRDLNIHDMVDEDFFQITAQDTGKLVVNMHHTYADGDLNMEIQDGAGTVLYSATSLTDDERLVFPVVGQQRYYIRVYGVNDAINEYDLEIENFRAPIPTAVLLDPATDTGSENNDNITANDTPNFVVVVGLDQFEDDGIPIDPDPGDPGATVRVQGRTLDGGSSFDLGTDPLSASSPAEWVTDNPFDLAEGVWVVTAYTRITDATGAVGELELSLPLLLTIDTTAPTPTTPDLLESSDSFDNVAGLIGPQWTNSDDVTAISAPAFAGLAEANSLIRIYATNTGTATVQLVGQGQVHSDSSDGSLGDGLGSWEVTVEPLADGNYDITAEIEDVAGNISTRSAPLNITVDALPPQRPTLDLAAADDTGSSDTDNITSAANPVSVTVTAEAGSRVLIKDGETVIDDFIMPAATTTRPLALAEGTHLLSAEAFDAPGNRSAQSEVLNIVIDRTAPTGSVPDMLTSSDTGFYNDDDVTYIDSPAFQGTGEPNSKVFVFAETVGTGIIEQVGQGVVGTDGTWEVTIEPLDHDFPVAEYRISAVYEDLAGNRSPAPVEGEGLQMWHDSTPPNVPYLDLIAEDDKGFSNTDNYTQDLTLHFDVTVNDTADDGNPVPNDVQWFIQDRVEDSGTGEVTVADSGGLSTAGFWDDVEITFADYGVHNLKLVAWDRAGHRSEFLLKVDIDPDACDESVLKLANGQVLVYDRDAVVKENSNGFEILTDITADDFKIIADKAGNVRKVHLTGNPTGLGLIINPADGGPVDFIDERNIPPGKAIENIEFIFLNGSSSKKVYIRSALNGEDLSDILKCEDYLVADPDLDGDGLVEDPTAFYAAGPIKSFYHWYDITGDVIVRGADPKKGLAIGKFAQQRGNFSANVDFVTPEGGVKSYSHQGATNSADLIFNGPVQKFDFYPGTFDGTLTLANTKKMNFAGPMNGNITFTGDMTGKAYFNAGTGPASELNFNGDLSGRLYCVGTFGGPATVAGDFTGRIGDKKTLNGPATLFLNGASTIGGFVYLQPIGSIFVTGEDLFFGGAFAAIDVV